MRVDDLVVAVVFSAAFCVGARPGYAQSWPTHDFELLAVDETTITSPLLMSLGELHETLAAFGLDPTTVGSFELPDSTREDIEQLLGQAAEILDQWGFGPPSLPRPATALGDYRVFIVDALEPADGQQLGPSGVHRTQYGHCLTRDILFLNAQAILIDGALSLRGRRVVVHELFHAVQKNSAFFGGVCGEWAGDWLTEGTADAVGWDMVRLLRSRDLFYALGFPPWGERSYSHLLAIPSRMNSPVSPYPTLSFWRYLSEYHGSGSRPPGPGSDEPIDYRYLARLLDSPPVASGCRAANSSCALEARWLDVRLRNMMGASLRELYSRFIGTYALYGGHRASYGTDFNGRRWRQGSFDESCRPVLITEDSKHIEDISRFGLFQEMSAQCWAVTLRGFDQDMNVLVTVEGSEAAWTLSDLSAIAARDTTRTGLPQVSEPQRPELHSDPDSEQPVAEFVLGFPDSTSWFLLTNFADDPAATRPMRDLRVTFIPLEGYAYMGSSVGGGGPSAADIDAPLPLSLDEIRDTFLFRNDSPNHARLGHEDVCSLQLEFANSSTPDGLGILMHHEGPIEPGDYPIYNDGEHGFSMDYVEANPGVALVSFGVDLGLTAWEQKYNSYLGRAGTLTLERVSPHLVQGRVEVSGDLICIPSPAQPECIGPPGLRVEAVFSVPPTHPVSSLPASPGCFARSPQPQTTTSGEQQAEQPDESSNPTPPPPPDAEGDPLEANPSTTEATTDDPTAPSDPGSSSIDGESGIAPGFVNLFSLDARDGVDTTLVFRGDAITITGGCTGDSPMSIGFHRGQPNLEDYVSFAFETAGPMGTGETGEFDVEEIRWDHGTVVPDNLPPGTTVRVPNRFTGTGLLSVSRHDAAIGQQRTTATITSDQMTNRQGTSVGLTVEFDINRSCGVAP
jgi:hypothetical protein